MARSGPFFVFMIIKLTGNPSLCNSYFLGEEGKECFLIDPGDNSNNRLDRFIDKHYSSLKGILLTHGHYDHILGLLTLTHKAPLYIGVGDECCLLDGKYNLLEGLEINGYSIHSLYDNDEVVLGDSSIKVITTPFHTEGSVCYNSAKENALISGDTLFHLSYGRYDLPGGDGRKVHTSLNKLKSLPSMTKVYPGHGENTVLETEFRFNPGFTSPF